MLYTAVVGGASRAPSTVVLVRIEGKDKTTILMSTRCSTAKLMFSRRDVLLGGSSIVALALSKKPRAQNRTVTYDVPLIAQDTAMSCWAAAIAMIVSWAQRENVTPWTIAKESDRLAEYRTGLKPLDSELFDRWGMMTEAPQTYTAEGFMDLLSKFGPIWAAAEVTAPHVRVVTGFQFADIPYFGPVYINDPLEARSSQFKPGNKGATYTETYVEFVIQNEKLGSEDLQDPTLNDLKAYPVYFAHLKRKPPHP